MIILNRIKSWEERDFFKEQAILWRKIIRMNMNRIKSWKTDNEYRKKIVDIIPQDEKSVAEETIQDLQERIRFLEQCLDNKEKS